MRTNLLNWCNMVSISKNVVFYVLLVVRIYKYLADFDHICFEKSSSIFRQYAVARTEHDALVKFFGV